jgi:hypothetical protein
MSKLIAFHLPQFHVVEENDRWWGKGFTEWSHLDKWAPVFEGHRVRRPHGDIGRYDLLETAARAKQAELAKRYGVYGFCYYHYWFGGKQLLEKPLDRMLLDGQPDLPFCFSWANEPWTRRWDGHEREVLMAQTYGGVEEWDAHLDYLLPFFRHPNYIRVDGKPMFLVYRLGQVTQWRERFARWRERLAKEGIPGLHLVMTLGNFSDNITPIAEADAVVEFVPNYLASANFAQRFFAKPGLENLANAAYQATGVTTFVDARKALKQLVSLPTVHPTQYRGIFSGWDNSPRVGKRATIYRGWTPELFAEHLRIQTQRGGEFVFVNAWNEWGEGAVLEPDDHLGYAALEAIAKSA